MNQGKDQNLPLAGLAEATLRRRCLLGLNVSGPKLVDQVYLDIQGIMAKTPNNNTRDNINSAIEKINSEGISANAHASTYEAVFENNRYLPK
ncbi:MAG TPA: hypothetical protein EYQ14_00280 [Gammaproteobacteria bacterium]|nr:hypothetical protein [Gammaproteobacteria bacterium]HIK71172.1 hypothetical protein [Pseudomonadales bacterium]